MKTEPEWNRLDIISSYLGLMIGTSFVKKVNVVNSYQANKRWSTRSLAIFTLWAAQWNQQFFYPLFFWFILYCIGWKEQCIASSVVDETGQSCALIPFHRSHCVILSWTTVQKFPYKTHFFVLLYLTRLYRCLNLCSLRNET